MFLGKTDGTSVRELRLYFLIDPKALPFPRELDPGVAMLCVELRGILCPKTSSVPDDHAHTETTRDRPAPVANRFRHPAQPTDFHNSSH